MNDFIAKPINPEALITTLSKWVAPNESGTGTSVAPQPANGLGHLPGFDLDNLLNLLGGNHALAAELLRSFTEEMAETPATIRAEALADRTVQARELAHRLKGAAGNLGATALHAATEKLEAELKNGRFDTGLMDAVDQEFANAKAAIAGLPMPEAAPAVMDGNTDALHEAAQVIDQLLKENEFIGMETISALEQHLPTQKRQTLAELRKLVGEIRYDEARKVLQQLVDESL